MRSGEQGKSRITRGSGCRQESSEPISETKKELGRLQPMAFYWNQATMSF